MDSLNVKGIVRLRILIPPKRIVQSFDILSQPIRRRIEMLVDQNAKLRTTRDLLLPKLIAGEVDVPAAEEELAGAAV